MQLERNQQGISLIEILISMVIFAVGILGMATLQTRVLQENVDQRQRDVAIWKTQALIERISLNKSSNALKQYASSVSASDICDSTPSNICAESYSGNSEQAAATCSDTQLAIYDSWDVLCTNDQGAADILRDFSASLSCDTADCLAGEDVIVEFLWRSLTAQSDPRISASALTNTTTLTNSGADIDGYRQVFRP